MAYHTYSAVARVFAIPELLEEILFCAVHQAQRDVDNVMLLEPMPGHCVTFSLFRAYRVNKTFARTIDASVRLKRLMFVEPGDNSSKAEADKTEWEKKIPDHQPLLCALNVVFSSHDDDSFLSIDEKRTFDDDHGIIPTVHIRLQSQGLKGHSLRFLRLFHGGKLAVRGTSGLHDGWYREEASWKLIRISNSFYGPMPIRLSLEADEGWLSEVQPNIGRPCVAWEFKGDESLGDVWNLFQRLWMFLDERRTEKAEVDKRFGEMAKMMLAEEFGKD